MTQFERQSVMVMLGIPGSGKTCFAKRLAAETGAVLIDGDAVRNELFPDRAYKTEAERRLPHVEYARRYEQVLESGRSVVRGNQRNSLKRRDELSQRLGEMSIAYFIIWMRTPTDIANRRAIQCEIDEDYPPAIRRGPEKIRDNADHILKTFDPPAEHELCVEIDGQADFKDQFRVFSQFCKAHNLME